MEMKTLKKNTHEILHWKSATRTYPGKDTSKVAVAAQKKARGKNAATRTVRRDIACKEGSKTCR